MSVIYRLVQFNRNVMQTTDVIFNFLVQLLKNLKETGEINTIFNLTYSIYNHLNM